MLNYTNLLFYKLIGIVLLLTVLIIGCSISPLIRDKDTITNSLYPLNNRIKNQVFYRNPEMKNITHIVFGELDLEPRPEIGVFDQTSLQILNLEGGNKNRIFLNWKYGIIDPGIRIKKPGEFEILARSMDPVGVMDKSGRPIWIYDKERARLMVSGDLDNNGIPEYYVIAASDLIKLNEHGNEIWKISDIYFTGLDILKLAGRNQKMLVTNSANGIIHFRDHFGKIIKEIVPEKELDDFMICKWEGSQYILGYQGKEIILLDINGRIVINHKIGFMRSDIFGIKGTSVTFEDNRTYLAVVVNLSSSLDRSYLCIFSPENELIFQEALRKTTGLLAVELPQHDGSVILVGDGWGTVKKYWSP